MTTCKEARAMPVYASHGRLTKVGARPYLGSDGFTLLEMLAVVAILALLAGGAVLAVTQTKEDTELQVARSEMLAIKQAALKFKLDTGYLPKQGPFELAPAAGAPCIATNSNGAAPLPIGQTREGYCSPANFYQLYQNPLAGTGHPLEQWNPDTLRGWRGPYLTREGEGFVDIGDNLQSNGVGNPVAGTLREDLFGVTDPFVAARGTCQDPNNPVLCYLGWSPAPNIQTASRWGRPYYLFDPDDAGLGDTKEARIVSGGPNATYDCDRDNNSVCDAADVNGATYPLCAPPAPGGKLSDDLILCLLR
jgi:prepilin-type N-terminal cleavage/methylation domain-containing protein